MNILRRISAIVIVAASINNALPAMAQRGDSAATFDDPPFSVITGSGNSVTNRSTQTNVGVRNGRGTGGSTGVVQPKNQTVDITGDPSVVRGNTNCQTNTDPSSGRRRIISCSTSTVQPKKNQPVDITGSSGIRYTNTQTNMDVPNNGRIRRLPR